VRATDARVALAAARAMQVMGNDYGPRGAGWPNELDDDEHPSAMRRFIAVHQRNRVSRKLQYLHPPTALRPNGRLWDEAVVPGALLEWRLSALADRGLSRRLPRKL